MPCTKCNTEFTLLTWKIKCSDCEMYYCTKCLRKTQGVLYCDKCVVLNKRPPEREKLMELRSKDLQDYLNKNHISTHGLVEKSELVELFYRRAIPAGNKKNQSRLASVLSGSVPNIAAQGQDQINQLKSNINNMRSYAESTLHNLGRKIGPQEAEQNNFAFEGQTFHTFLNTEVPFGQQNNVSVNTSVRTETYMDNSQPTSSSNQQATHVEPTPPTKYPKLSDFNSIEQLNELSIKQLKELLTLNRVDFKGCVEKSELLDRAQRLWLDNNQYKDKAFEDANVENLCKICMDAPLDCVLLECGHVATCIQCGKQLAECPICRQFVSRVVRTFKA
ncbi:E3 ubiquitin-protein ligase rififylin [Photinus pyralis]|uniref:RING-type domain-containing protein n=3 Tax=Photinus pyralis TaxID=7054 RepID=A0A1Y1MD77_PHOPY|nr:E3 ubiquitin-protein ligase rififylin [Photinus pyralis]XP_031351525.1 E3 ubiquitin-protein ligase rififylin [Photinus pyralis]